jgi:hypothetical protein
VDCKLIISGWPDQIYAPLRSCIMIQLRTYTTSDLCPTQHAMLIVWGHFARTLGLLDRLASVPIQQKTVTHAPHQKLVEFLIGLLSGMEYLTELSSGPTPLVQDHAVASAWQLEMFAAASTVSRTLKASDRQTVEALRAARDAVGQPLLDQAIAEMHASHQRLLLSADLTGRPVSSTSRTYPDAAFGYMDGELRLGYQVAEICVQTTLFGRQWLSARQHPGSSVSGSCLLSLIEDAERRLNCHPRRRTELVEQHLAACSQTIAEEERLAAQHQQRSLQQRQRLERLAIQIVSAQAQIGHLQAEPLWVRQAGPYSHLSRLQKQVARWQRHQERATAQRVHADAVESHHRARAQTLRHAREQLQTYLERLCRENADEATLVPCTIRLDAGFSSGENLSALIEKGYDLETKSGNDALLSALRKQVTNTTV